MDVLDSLEVMGFHTLDGLTVVELKERYKEKAKEYHPDKRGGDSRMFVNLSNAYTTLKDIVSVQEAMEKGVKEERSRHRDNEDNFDKRDDKKIKNALVLHRKALKKNKDQIDMTKEEVLKITEEHLVKERILKEEFQNVLNKIRAEYKETFIQKIRGWLKMSRNATLEEREQALKEKFESIQKDLDNEYSHQLVGIYGKSLNSIQKNLNDLSL